MRWTRGRRWKLEVLEWEPRVEAALSEHAKKRAIKSTKRALHFSNGTVRFKCVSGLEQFQKSWWALGRARLTALPHLVARPAVAPP